MSSSTFLIYTIKLECVQYYSSVHLGWKKNMLR